MSILDRYIIKELLGPFIFGVTAFSSIFIGTSTFIKIAQFITQYGAPIPLVIKYLIYSLPTVLVFTLPMSMLLASLMAIGRLSGASEITAMRSGGISFYRLSLPVFIVAFAVSAFSIVFTEAVVPEAKARMLYVQKYEIEKELHFKTQEYIVYKQIDKGQGQLRRLVYARNFEEATGMMTDVTMQEFDKNNKIVRLIIAQRAIWEKDKWTMYNGVVNDLTSKGSRSMSFDKQLLPINDNPAKLAMEQKSHEEMTIKELKQHIAVLKEQHAPVTTLSLFEVELYNRVSVPMASFVFALIGTPLGLQPHRSSSSIGLGISIVVIFIYYTIMSITQALGQSATLPPLLAVWIPNIIGIAVGVVLVYKNSR